MEAHNINTKRSENNGANAFIIPAIDLINGKVVRLTHGDFDKEKQYYNDPLDAALQFEAAGLQRLHLVDLDGAKSGRIRHLKVLEKIAKNTSLNIDFGGGVHHIQDVSDIINAGASMITIGSMAVKQPEVLQDWIIEFGSDRFFVGADVYEEKIRIGGWLEDGGVGIYQFLRNMISIGASQFFCTDISKDGAMQGTSVELYKKIISQFPDIKLTASGGVTTLGDIELLKKSGCASAIVGKAIYEGLISLTDLEKFN